MSLLLTERDLDRRQSERSHVIATHGAMKPAPNCAADDAQLGPCTAWCGRSICLRRESCVRPRRAPSVRPSLWSQLVRRWRIWRASVALSELETHYRALASGGVYGPDELRKVRDQVGAARVDLSIAQRRL